MVTKLEESGWRRVVVGAHVLAATGLGIALYGPWLDVGLYGFFTDALGVLVLVAGLPVAIVYVMRFWGREAKQLNAQGVWATFAIVMLLGVAGTALGDAGDFRQHNCWLIQGADDEDGVSVWECVPGHGSPREWSGSNPDGEGSSRFCDQINTSSSRGTVWRCETSTF